VFHCSLFRALTQGGSLWASEIWGYIDDGGNIENPRSPPIFVAIWDPVLAGLVYGGGKYSMMRADKLKGMGRAGALTLGALFGPLLIERGMSAEATDRPPNILLIMADDLGWWDTRFQGNQDLETPALDAFARSALTFSHGYAAAPVCTPTRAAMMTGMAPARLHITNHAPGHAEGMVPEGRTQAGAKKLTYLSLEATTLAERLRDEAGYATGFVGKWHLSHRPGRNEDGALFEPLLRPEYQGFDLNIGG